MLAFMSARLALVLACLAVAACDREYPCARSRDVTLEVLEGPGNATVTCGGEETALAIDLSAWPPAFEGNETKRSVTAGFSYDAPAAEAERPGPLPIYLELPRDLPDGTYPADDARLTLSVGAGGGTIAGTVTFTRTRDVVFADVTDPKNGSHRSTLDLTLDLSGRGYVTDCGEDTPYVVPRTRIRLQSETTVGACQGGASH